jgi:type VI secretion system secreted protein Hcp
MANMSKVLLLALIFGIIATMSLGSAYAASADYFLKIEGVDGESSDGKHKGEIQIESWSWGVSNAGSMSMGGGGGAGKVSMQDFHFTHQVDKSSPKLFMAMATGEHLKQVTLTVRKAGGDQQEYLTYTFTDVLVTSLNTSASSDDPAPSEQVSFNFTKIEMEYKPQSAAGTVEAPIKASWDLKTNTR